MSKRQQSRRQKQMRRRRNEKAFLFDKDLTQVLGAADRLDWEVTIDATGGDVAAAAEVIGLQGIPRSAKVLWGQSAQAALDTYRRWKKRKAGAHKGRKRR